MGRLIGDCQLHGRGACRTGYFGCNLGRVEGATLREPNGCCRSGAAANGGAPGAGLAGESAPLRRRAQAEARHGYGRGRTRATHVPRVPHVPNTRPARGLLGPPCAWRVASGEANRANPCMTDSITYGKRRCNA